jgi:hypothetical protein
MSNKKFLRVYRIDFTIEFIYRMCGYNFEWHSVRNSARETDTLNLSSYRSIFFSVVQILVACSWRTQRGTSSGAWARRSTMSTKVCPGTGRLLLITIYVSQNRCLYVLTITTYVSQNRWLSVHESLPGDWQTFTDNNIRLSEQVTIRPWQFARGLADFHR